MDLIQLYAMVKLAKEAGDVGGVRFLPRKADNIGDMNMSKRKNRGNNVKAEKQTITKAEVGTISAKDLGGEKGVSTNAQAASGTPPAQPTAAARTATSHPGTIKVLRTDVRYKGNREAWFNRLKEFDGKPLDDFLANTTEKPPALTRNGTPEPPMGWFSFFKREQVASVVTG